MQTWFRRLSAKGILFGGLTDIVATNIAFAPLAVSVFARLGSDSLTPAQQQAVLRDAFTSDSRFYLTGLLLGCAASVLGGWVAARLARRDEQLNGALSAFACVGFGIYGMVAQPQGVPLWQHLSFLVLSPALGALGGTIRMRQRMRAPVAQEPATMLENPGRLPLVGLQRAVLVANRVLMAAATIGLLLFGVVGLIGYSQHQPEIVTGSVMFSVFVALGLVLFVLAARALRAGRSRHWPLHAAALVVTLLPILLIVVGMLSQRRSG
jgi:hypothetical protein